MNVLTNKHWFGSVILVFGLLILSFFISLVREQAQGQAPGLPFGGGTGNAPQVFVRPPMEPPRWLVDFVMYESPANPAQKIRVITVVDPESKHIVVYHEDLATGQVKMVSSRNIQNDLLLDQFNAASPTPSEIEKEIRRLRNQ